MSAGVARLEIADCLERLFAHGPVDRQSLPAEVAGARPELGRVLRSLPEREFTSLRQIWEHLPHIPVGV